MANRNKARTTIQRFYGESSGYNRVWNDRFFSGDDSFFMTSNVPQRRSARVDAMTPFLRRYSLDFVVAFLVFLGSLATYHWVGTQFYEKTKAYKHTVFGVDSFAVTRHMCDPKFRAKQHRSTAHPLFVLFFRPACGALKNGMDMATAAMSISILFASIGNVLFFLCLRKIGLNGLTGALFTAILAFSFPHLLFGSIAETYILVFASLVLLLAIFLFVENQKTFMICFLPASLFTIGITLTNIVFVVIVFFFKVRQKSGFTKTLMYLLVFVALIAISFVGLILLQKETYPAQKYFFSSSTISSNTKFLRDDLMRTPAKALGRRLPHFFVYNLVAPGRIRNVVTFPGLSQVRPATILTMTLLLFLVILSAWMIVKLKAYRGETFWTLFSYLLFNVGFFLFYGYEPHLYQAHYTFAWVALLALPFGLRNAMPRTVLYAGYVCMFIFVPLLALNNWDFVKTVLYSI